jgi:hypothetical protein
MNTFVWSRFIRVFCNDLQQQWRKIWIATLGFIGIAMITYLTNVDPRQLAEPRLFLVLFPIALLGGGLIFTSAIFSDMHHPLQRFHYLTLPYSNLERFLSRYLLTGPLFFLYVLVTYTVFDNVAAGLAEALFAARAAAFPPFAEVVGWYTLAYFCLHSLMLTGAIYFRSYHLLKTALAGALFCVGLFIVQIVAVKLVFWDYFRSFWSLNDDIPVQPLLLGRTDLQVGFLVLLHVWVLYIGYRCLCEHEVQDEL